MAIKVLHIYKDFYPVLGGIENHIKLLTQELAKDRNFEVQVLVTNLDYSTKIEYFNNVEVIKTKRLFHFASTPVSFQMFSYVKKLKADIVHLHFPYPLGELATLIMGNYKRIILSYHGDIVKQKYLFQLYKPFLKKMFNKVNIVIASNPNYIGRSDMLRSYQKKIEIIPYGVDLERFERREENGINRIQEEYGAPLILFVGKFRYYKGLQYLLEASKEVEAKFLLIGEGNFRSELEEYVVENSLQQRVFFLGEVDDEELPSYYQASDIFVLPSSHPSEAFGICLLEAMACDLPLISTELETGTSFVNLHGKTGLVVSPRNAKALSQAINYLLTNKDYRVKLGKAGKQRVKEEFSQEIMVKRIKNLYYKLCQ